MGGVREQLEGNIFQADAERLAALCFLQYFIPKDLNRKILGPMAQEIGAVIVCVEFVRRALEEILVEFEMGEFKEAYRVALRRVVYGQLNCKPARRQVDADSHE